MQLARFARIGPSYYISLFIVLPLMIYMPIFYLSTQKDKISHYASLILCPVALQSWTPWTTYGWSYPLWVVSTLGESFRIISFICNVILIQICVEVFFWFLFPWICPLVKKSKGLLSDLLVNIMNSFIFSIHYL